MNKKISAAIGGGLVGGALDISYALTYAWFHSDVAPVRVLQFVASGVLGRSAFEGGLPAAALGLGVHFFLAICAAAVFVAAAGRMNMLVQRPIVSGVLFGVLMYGFMNLVAVPLSQVHRNWPPMPLSIVTDMLSHMFFFGVPIALAARRAYLAPAP